VVVKGLGDGILARSGGAAEALDAAVAIQRASIELARIHGLSCCGWVWAPVTPSRTATCSVHPAGWKVG
jgi:hypothetical protein